MDRIPVSEPLLAGNEIAYVTDAIKSGWISGAGEYLDRFESEFAAYCGVRHGIGTTSGTTALHLALAALGVGPGDEVIVPDFTMIACAFAVCYCGAVPVFVDAEPRTWNMDVEKVEARITKRTKAIMAVHIYGHPTDMVPLQALAAAHNLRIIEDAAEAHGARYRSRPCGGLGNIAAFSFYANKAITTGEGGMVVTNDDELAARCRSLRNLSFDNGPSRTYLHERLAFNYRLSNVQAALGVAQLERLEENVGAKRSHARRYSERLRRVVALQLPREEPWALSSYWMYGVVLSDGAKLERDEFARLLDEAGIGTRPFFQPMHRQPALRRFGTDRARSYPVADRLAHRGLYLPSGTGLSDVQIDRVCERVTELLG